MATMATTVQIVTRREQAVRAAPLTGQCFSHARSGELVRAVLIEGDMLVLDEYGTSFWVSPDEFDRLYVRSSVCPLS